MLLHNLGRGLALAAVSTAGACGGDTPPPKEVQSEERPSTPVDAGRTKPPPSMDCEPGEQQACYCTDGTKSGTQECSARGTLQTCECPPPKPPPVQTSMGGPLCPDLVEQTGCMATPYVSKELPTSMLFVIDRSRSMMCNLPPLQDSVACEEDPVPVDPSQPSKWVVTRDALIEAFDGLPGKNSLLGLTYFSTNGGCGVDSTPQVTVDPLVDSQRTLLRESLESTMPDGQTPIVGATVLAYNHLHEEAKAPGNRFVVLLTDGAESCDPDRVSELLDVEVQKARDANIRTFVIGAPGSEGARALLSELAFRGGTAASPSCTHDINGPVDQGDCHLDMTQSMDFAASLASALATVSAAVQDCTFAVPPNPGGKADDVNVQYSAGGTSDPVCFSPVVGDCASVDGWQFARDASGQEDFTRVVLCGQACETIKQDPKARVDILVGCAPVIVI
jgi:hypothetical protein